MKFCCSNCGREEEIILDRTPRCLSCDGEMIAASDYSVLWMSPYTAIVRMQTIGETYGVDLARRDGDLRRSVRLGRPPY
jgi:hypothetical protein